MQFTASIIADGTRRRLIGALKYARAETAKHEPPGPVNSLTGRADPGRGARSSAGKGKRNGTIPNLALSVPSVEIANWFWLRSRRLWVAIALPNQPIDIIRVAN